MTPAVDFRERTSLISRSSAIGYWLVIFVLIGKVLAQPVAENSHPDDEASPAKWQCGGALENAVWQHWEKWGKPYLVGELLGRRLSQQGDSYALYDAEISFHNLLAMAQRCRRGEQQRAIAESLRTAFSRLGPLPSRPEELAWVCRGGDLCNRKLRTLDSEVVLNSVQFLALLTQLARDLTSPVESAAIDDFKRQTARVVVHHLGRWNSPAARSSLRKRIAATVGDVKDGSSLLFLTDIDLWTIAVYADLSGMLQREPQLGHDLALTTTQLAALREHAELLLDLLNVRTLKTTRQVDHRGPEVSLAELDRGFWWRYRDHRYAGYSRREPPVRCVADPDDPSQQRMEVVVEAASVPLVADVGWDISHARRVVHVLEALERNRSALTTVWGVSAARIPGTEDVAALARQFRFKVWNQDVDRPLFANYYSGVNGWYRVAYDNGTGRCREGYPPFGLSDSFPTGGYATWAPLEPILGLLGRRLYSLTRSSAEADQAFVAQYYRVLSQRADPRRRALNELMFWPTLIGN